MAQHDYVIANGTGAAVRSDLNNALAAIVSQNSGATEPATTYAFQFWADTTTGTLKLRNSANSAWIELLQLDGTLTMEDGTEALPGLSFRSDLDTGLWRPGTNQLAISTNAVERVEFGASEVVFNDGGANYDFRVEGDTNANLLFVDASADAVGIGTSSPGSNLDVRFATNPITDNGGGNNALRVWTSSALAIDTGGAISLGGIYRSSDNDAAAFAQIAGRKENATTNNLLGYLQFATNGATGSMVERMRITGAGNVGIGNTPSQRLTVGAGSGPESIVIYTGSGNTGELRFSDTNTDYQGAIVYSHVDNSMSFAANGSSEAMRIDSSKRLLVGTSSYSDGATLVLQGNSTNSNWDAILRLLRNISNPAADETLGSIIYGVGSAQGAQIQGVTDAQWGTNDYPTRLVFSTTADGASSPTERMRITNGGEILIGTTTFNPGLGNTTSGIHFGGSNGFGIFSRSSGIPLYAARNTDDGTLIEFRQDGTTEGSISVSGTTVTLNGAHLSRWSQIPGIDPHDKTVRPEILRGTVMSNLDEMCDWIDPDSGDTQANEQLNKTKISDIEGDKNVAGVFQSWDDDDDTWVNDYYLAMTGDFVIRIKAGVTVERGDLLMSAGDGTAKPQADDAVRSCTIAKVTSTHVSHTHPDGSYCVPCVLMAC